MSAREEILSRIRRQPLPAAELPELRESWIEYTDRAAQFIEVLGSVGGQAVLAADRAALPALIAGLDSVRDARRIACTVEGLPLGNVELTAVADPHELADVDVAIVGGELAVAENAAVWVTDRSLVHRALPFIAQRLVLVVDRGTLVDNLHQAYERLRFDGPGYGVFISGPSKTADIEQSLVIGAHGPRSLVVALVG